MPQGKCSTRFLCRRSTPSTPHDDARVVAGAPPMRSRVARTQEENDGIPTWVAAPRWELTPRTFSLSADVGMYLCQVFVHNHPSLTWAQPMGSKRFIDYGHPS